MPMPPVYKLPTLMPSSKEIVPRIFHYTYLVAPGRSYPFGLLPLLSIRSVLKFGKPKQIIFHCSPVGCKPTGGYWDMAVASARKARVKLVCKFYDWEFVETAPNGVKFRFVAGMSDLLRIRALLTHGGIYLDADMLVLKDISDLLHYPYVAGVEKSNWLFPYAIEGLLSAFIVAEKNASFLKRWYEVYATKFSSSGRYNHYAIQIPWKLAKMPGFNDIHVLPFTATAFPLYSNPKKVFKSNEYRYVRDSYGLHLWDKMFKKHLEPYLKSPSLIYQDVNLFTSLARTFLTQKEARFLSDTREPPK